MGKRVEYGYDGVRIRSATVDNVAKVTALQMALMQAQRNGRKDLEVDLRGGSGGGGSLGILKV